MVKKILPMPGYVLVKPIEPEAMNSSGIILPSNGSESQQTGIVVSVGGSKTSEFGVLISSPVSIDEEVIFMEWSKQKYKLEGDTYYLIKFSDIVAIIK